MSPVYGKQHLPYNCHKIIACGTYPLQVYIYIVLVCQWKVEGSGSRVVGSLTCICSHTLWQACTLSHSDDDDTTDNRVLVSQLAHRPTDCDTGTWRKL